jgi:uncharacterized protein YbbC (DUF1343 family)
MRNGLDRVASDARLLEGLGRIGLVTNQAATTHDFRPCAEVVHAACRTLEGSSTGANAAAKPSQGRPVLARLFGPQHGYWQTEQDNMIETPDLSFALGSGESVSLLSLYSQTRIPRPEQLDGLDTLVVDLSDVGCRVYTYMLTLAACMKAAAAKGLAVVVLDRPNPLGLAYRKGASRWERVEGNTLDLKWHSFVGWYEIPMRHGLTMGELGRYFKKVDGLETLDYRVVEVEGLTRAHGAGTLRKLPWTLPSPNLPTWDCAFAFPSFVPLEGTNVSEGRGTTLPFQVVGAPYLQADAVREDLLTVAQMFANTPAAACGGMILRRHDFRPTFNKHAKDWCRGLQFHVHADHDNEQETHHGTSREGHLVGPQSRSASCNHNAFALGVWFLASVVARHKEDFRWKDPGYEYNFTDPPLNLIHGNEKWLQHFERMRGQGFTQGGIEETASLLAWADDEAQEFARSSAFAHIYPAPP